MDERRYRSPYKTSQTADDEISGDYDGFLVTPRNSTKETVGCHGNEQHGHTEFGFYVRP